MELRFEQETKEIWRECFRREDSILVELEGVVPDVNEDVGRVASVQCSVMLKSKELKGQTLVVGGEAEAVVLYITENADGVASVRLNREFEQEIALGDGVSAEEAQAVLRVARSEGRILNPRKLAVSVQLVCTSRGYRKESMTLSLMPDGDAAPLLLGRAETARAQVVTAVTEKSFAITESFLFPEGRATPEQILCRDVRFRLGEQNRIGTRLIVKGTMELELCYMAEGLDYPLHQSFSAPLSQILELGTEGAACCTLNCVPTAVYLDLIDSISGDKALETEVHALLQAACRSEVELRYLSDAYSNAMPLSCRYRELAAETAGQMESSAWSASELIAVGDDCADVLAVLSALGGDRETPRADLDILYRSKNGDIAAARRQLALKGERPPADAQLLSAAITRSNLIPEGEGLQCEIQADYIWQRSGSRVLRILESAELDEEHPFDLSSLPAVTLVRVEGESLWELTRSYHSSTDAVTALNDAEEREGKMLLIPRA